MKTGLISAIVTAISVTLLNEYFAARRIKIEIAHQEVMCQVKLDAQKETYELKEKRKGERIDVLEKRQQDFERVIDSLEKLVAKLPK